MTGLAAHSSQILPSALTVSERAHVGALGSAAWQEVLQTAWRFASLHHAKSRS